MEKQTADLERVTEERGEERKKREKISSFFFVLLYLQRFQMGPLWLG